MQYTKYERKVVGKRYLSNRCNRVIKAVLFKKPESLPGIGLCHTTKEECEIKKR